MKIEKIKNFNHIMFAIASIIGILLLIYGLITAISDLFWRYGADRHTTITNSLYSDEYVEKVLTQENLLKPIISYQLPLLIDTLNSAYIIPVSITSLDKMEKNMYYEEEQSLADIVDITGIRGFSKKGYYHTQFFEGQFINLILYQPVINKTKLLFNEKIMMNKLQAYYFKDDILLVFYTYEKDTNSNDLIDIYDDKNLCIYSIKSGKIRKITDNVNLVKNYKFIENSKDLLVEFSLNQYKETINFNSYNKPTKVMKYNFETEKLSEIVPAEIQQQMQKLIEGKK